MALWVQPEGTSHELMQVPGNNRVRSLINQRKTEATGLGKEEGQREPGTLSKLQTVRTSRNTGRQGQGVRRSSNCKQPVIEIVDSSVQGRQK